MFWFTDMLSGLPLIIRFILGLATGVFFGAVLALMQLPGYRANLKDMVFGTPPGDALELVEYKVQVDEDASFEFSDDVQQALQRAKENMAQREDGDHVMAKKYWPAKELRVVQHEEAIPFPIGEDCLVRRSPPWNLEGRCVICAVSGEKSSAIERNYPDMSPFCSSQVPGLEAGIELFALEAYVTAHETSKRLKELKALLNIPLNMLCVDKVIGFDLALDEALKERKEEPPPSCADQRLVFSYEGRQGMTIEDDRLLRTALTRSGEADVRYQEILNDSVGGYTRGESVSASSSEAGASIDSTARARSASAAASRCLFSSG